MLDGPSLQSFDIHLPDKIPLVEVRGSVVKVDGSGPAPGDQVGLRIGYEQIDFDAEGNFHIELCKGVPYEVYAWYGSPKPVMESGDLTFTPTDETKQLRVVIDKVVKPLIPWVPDPR